MEEVKTYPIGTIVGRFQVHELHDAHKKLIDQVANAHKKVILFLGVPKVIGTKKNPLDFESRKKMIQHHYPNIIILALPDNKDDKKWTKELEKRIREVYATGEVLLYGGRDSFIPYYKNNGGIFDCEELVQYTFVSGTEVRKKASDEVKDSEDFRAGLIYQAYNQFPKVHPFVNIAIVDSDKVLLARSPYDSKWKFIGGFVRPLDKSYELAAKRKISEDVGVNLEIGNLKYIGSTQIADWRYKSEEDEVITNFYKTDRGWGNIEPSDDISELKFWDIKDIDESIMVDEHKSLLSMFIIDMKK